MARVVPLALLAAVAVAGGAYKAFVHFSQPVTPALVTRTDDAHELLSPSIAARIDRFFRDRPPVDRSESPRLVALTFDDGPYPVETPLLLDVLADEHVRATFFLIGDDALQYPALTRRIAAGGHEIGNHTLTHPADFEALDGEQVVHELDGAAAALGRFVNDPAIRTMMRPPHGRFTEATAEAAQRDGYDIILWNDDPGDWRAVPPETLAEHIERYATAPDIILLHSGRLATVEMLPQVIRRFKAAGFQFVTVGELLRRVPVVEIDHPAKHPV
ncbi:MAG: polysaccharide deacetylase family protein [Candidatus Baltobacteraceae bacterium]|jgi:peptidoglycan/xylan/chitin deacetylase (PgdA/CDA1 family)